MALPADLRTMGVSSSANFLKCALSSALSFWSSVLAYAEPKRPQAEVREVNQSPVANRIKRGTKCSVIWPADITAASLVKDSTAYCCSRVKISPRQKECKTYLVSHYCFFDCGESFQRSQKDFGFLRSSNILREFTKLLCESQQNFIFIINALCGEDFLW